MDVPIERKFCIIVPHCPCGLNANANKIVFASNNT